MSLRNRAAKVDESFQPRLWIVLGGLLLLGAYVIYFIVANAHRVTIHFLFFSATLSLIWVILLCVGIGVLAGMLLSQLYGRRRGSAQK